QVLVQAGEFVAPGPVGLGIGKQRIDTGFAGFLVLQQAIGDAAVGRDDKDPPIQIPVLAPPPHAVVAHGRIHAHLTHADLLDGMRVVLFTHAMPSASSGYTPCSSCTSLPFRGGLKAHTSTRSSPCARSRCWSC